MIPENTGELSLGCSSLSFYLLTHSQFVTWSDASEGVSHSSPPLHSLLVFGAVGRKRPPLCGGTPPATPPFKTRPASRPTDPRLLYPIHCPQPFPLMLVHDACRQSRRLPRPGLQFYNHGLRRPQNCVLRGPSWTKRSCSCRSAVAVLQLPFFVPLSGLSWTKRSCRWRSAVAVLRAPSRPFVDKKKLQLPFCSCRSPRPFVDQKGVPHDPPRADHN